MPRFDLAFANDSRAAVEIVRAAEVVRIRCAMAAKQLTLPRLEAMYELAYLRAFIAWELCLESVFYRSLLGYASAAGGCEQLVAGKYFRSIDAAGKVVAPRGYSLWHNPHDVIGRCATYIRSGSPRCPAIQEGVIRSSVSRIASFSAIRHRIAHGQHDAKVKFDAATNALHGRTYPASRPGRFLRDINPSSGSRWLESIVLELGGLAAQIV